MSCVPSTLGKSPLDSLILLVEHIISAGGAECFQSVDTKTAIYNYMLHAGLVRRLRREGKVVGAANFPVFGKASSYYEGHKGKAPFETTIVDLQRLAYLGPQGNIIFPGAGMGIHQHSSVHQGGTISSGLNITMTGVGNANCTCSGKCVNEQCSASCKCGDCPVNNQLGEPTQKGTCNCYCTCDKGDCKCDCNCLQCGDRNGGGNGSSSTTVTQTGGFNWLAFGISMATLLLIAIGFAWYYFYYRPRHQHQGYYQEPPVEGYYPQ